MRILWTDARDRIRTRGASNYARDARSSSGRRREQLFFFYHAVTAFTRARSRHEDRRFLRRERIVSREPHRSLRLNRAEVFKRTMRPVSGIFYRSSRPITRHFSMTDISIELFMSNVTIVSYRETNAAGAYLFSSRSDVQCARRIKRSNI